MALERRGRRCWLTVDAPAPEGDASLHEHLASVAGEAWADELAKALVPPAAGTARAMLGDGCASAATKRRARQRRDARDEEARPSRRFASASSRKTGEARFALIGVARAQRRRHAGP